MKVDRRAMMAMAGGTAALAALSSVRAVAAAPPRLAPDRELRVKVEGGDIYVRVNGRLDGPKPPLLMAHGGPGGSHAVFLPALELADERAVILYDQLDSGLSDRPGDPANWTVARFAGEIPAIAETLGIERMHLLGHSWGATVALEHAAAHADGLASLVLQGPLVSTRAWLEDAAKLRASLAPEVQVMLDRCEGPSPPPREECAAADEAFYKRFWRLRPPPAYLDEYGEARAQQLNPRVYETMWGRSEFVATGTLKDYDGEPLLARVETPTLFLIGASDEIMPETAHRFADRMRNAQVAVIPDAAHRIQTDATAAYNRTLRRWLAEHDR